MLLWKWSTLQGFVLQGTKPCTMKVLLNPNKKAEKPFYHVGWLHALCVLEASCTILILLSNCLYCGNLTRIYLCDFHASHSPNSSITDIRWEQLVISNSHNHKMHSSRQRH